MKKRNDTLTVRKHSLGLYLQSLYYLLDLWWPLMWSMQFKQTERLQENVGKTSPGTVASFQVKLIYKKMSSGRQLDFQDGHKVNWKRFLQWFVKMDVPKMLKQASSVIRRSNLCQWSASTRTDNLLSSHLPLFTPRPVWYIWGTSSIGWGGVCSWPGKLPSLDASKLVTLICRMSLTVIAMFQSSRPHFQPWPAACARRGINTGCFDTSRKLRERAQLSAVMWSCPFLPSFLPWPSARLPLCRAAHPHGLPINTPPSPPLPPSFLTRSLTH